MVNSIPRVGAISLLSRAGPNVIFHKAVGRVWSTKLLLGLRCDLASLPPIRPAKFEITMKPSESRTFTGFTEELEHVKGADFFEALERLAVCEAGVPGQYVAAGPDGSPAYTQWLITPSDQHLLRDYKPGHYLMLKADEVLLEWAYTFALSRRTGVMADGMGQLLRIARAQGARFAFTYVAGDNMPSLRGCANVGFTLDHVWMKTRRLGHGSSLVRPPDEHALGLWNVATAPRPSA